MQSMPPALTSSVNKSKVIWGIVCLVAPTALILFTLIAYAITNFMFSSIEPPTDSLYTQCPDTINGVCKQPMDYNYEEPALRTITNIVLFLVGAVATLVWLPGVIIGIVLLATSKK